MPGYRHATADGVQVLQIDGAGHHALALGQTGGDGAPWLDQAAVAEGLATVGMGAALVGREHKTPGLDRRGAQQDYPMGSTSYRRKGRRDHDQLGPATAQPHLT